jgi:hypothetical protein
MKKAVLIMDRHRFDADLDPNFHFDADPGSVKTMPIHMWVLTQVILSICDKFSKKKKKYMCLEFTTLE